MTKIQALDLLSKVTSQMNSDRNTHLAILEALKVLQDLVASNKTKESNVSKHSRDS